MSLRKKRNNVNFDCLENLLVHFQMNEIYEILIFIGIYDVTHFLRYPSLLCAKDYIITYAVMRHFN